jgi:hypothetical protein
VDGTLTADLPLGPRVAQPDENIHIETGLPFFLRVMDGLFTRKAEKLYEKNIKQWGGYVSR